MKRRPTPAPPDQSARTGRGPRPGSTAPQPDGGSLKVLPSPGNTSAKGTSFRRSTAQRPPGYSPRTMKSRPVRRESLPGALQSVRCEARGGFVTSILPPSKKLNMDVTSVPRGGRIVLLSRKGPGFPGLFCRVRFPHGCRHVSLHKPSGARRGSGHRSSVALSPNCLTIKQRR